MSDGQETPTKFDARTGLTVMDIGECVEVLEKQPIGRVVFVDDAGQPIALPVNYRWHEDSVVFRTLEGQKLFAALMNRRVSFEVDDWDHDSRTGTSVLVKGKASRIDQWADREQLEQLGLVPWAHEQWRHVWIRVEPVEVTGRRIS